MVEDHAVGDAERGVFVKIVEVGAAQPQDIDQGLLPAVIHAQLFDEEMGDGFILSQRNEGFQVVGIGQNIGSAEAK